MHLLIDEYGMGIYKKSERVVIKKQGKVVEEIPFFEIEDIFFSTKGAVLSTDVIEECMKHGIQIHLLDYRQQPIASVYSPMLHATVKTRREQILSVQDYRSVDIVKELLTAKITNQYRVLKYYLKSRKETEEYEQINSLAEKVLEHVPLLQKLQGNCIAEVRDKFFAIEGRAATIYWHGVQQILQKKLDFSGREQRGTQDPVNMMFNYGYAILGGYVQSAILRAGLEPFAGLLHTDRPGKSSLQYDMIEVFRQPIVDRAVISILTKGFHPMVEDEGRLDSDTRARLREKIFQRLDGHELYNGKRYTVKTIIQMQAREIASYFRENKPYKAFTGSW